MELKIYAENFSVEEVEAKMECKIADGSELISAFPSDQLATELSQDQAFAGNGNWYTLSVAAGSILSYVPFADVNYCLLKITVVSDVYEEVVGGEAAVYAEITLAMAGYDKIDEFTGADQASIIEEQYKEGIKLRETDLVIYQY